MIICITAHASGMDAQAEQRFARAPFFTFVNTETGASESIENPLIDASGGVGPRAVQLLSDRGVAVVITGHVGGNAARALAAGGFKVFAYPGSGSVADALAAYNAGNLQPISLA